MKAHHPYMSGDGLRIAIRQIGMQVAPTIESMPKASSHSCGGRAQKKVSLPGGNANLSLGWKYARKHTPPRKRRMLCAIENPMIHFISVDSSAHDPMLLV